MGNIFKCNPETFIPRKDTELLVEQALKFINKNENDKIIVLDIGTGTGNIAITLALNKKNMIVYASDISKGALEIADQNINYYNLQNRVKLFHGELFNPLYNQLNDTKADLIISNPPYIPTEKLKQIDPKIIKFEPIHAFDGGPYGLNFIKKLIKNSPSCLKQNGILLFEFGEGQDKLINRLLVKNGNYTNIKFYSFQDKKRVVSAQYQFIN
jgi:release factor glutamine methyltransferase